MADWFKNCDACGALLIEGEHPATECYPKQWAIHTNRLLGEIAFVLRNQNPPKTATPSPAPEAPATSKAQPAPIAQSGAKG